MKYDGVIIGGGPAGVQAAISARNANPDKAIALIRKEKSALDPWGIPYVLHSLASLDDDIIPDSLLQQNDIDVIIGEISGRDSSVLSIRDGRHISFRKVVLAEGSVPVKPDIPGLDQPGVHILSRNYDHLVALRESVRAASRILIVGGGHLGVELADQMFKAGKAVTLVEAMPSLLPTSVDLEFSRAIADELERQGVEVIVGSGVKAFVGRQSFTGADLEDGRWITADLAIVAVGFQPSVRLAEKLGLQIAPGEGVVVDEYLRTSDPNIYAAGNCAVRRNYLTGELQSAMWASTAMAEGRLAGLNLFSSDVAGAFPGAVGSFATKVGSVSLGVTGVIETQARRLGLKYVVGCSETIDRHPDTLPGASQVYTKLIFSRSSHMLLGAQILGGDSVAESVNMLAVMLQKKTTDQAINALQVASHPLLTPSPLSYPVIDAMLDAARAWNHREVQRPKRTLGNSKLPRRQSSGKRRTRGEAQVPDEGGGRRRRRG